MKKTATLARRDAGISLGIVILLVFVTMALCFGAVALWARKAEINSDKKRLQAMLAAETAAAETIRAEQERGVAPTGLGPKEGEEGVISGADSAKAVSDRRQALFGEPKPTDSENVAALREDQYATFQSLIEEAGQRVSFLMIKHQRAELEAKLARTYLEAKTAARPEILKDRELFKSRLQDLIRDLNQRLGDVTSKYNESRAGLAAQVDKLKADTELAEAEFRDHERRETGRIRKMQHDLDQMRQKEYIKHRVNVSHGRVLNPDTLQKTAFINLGSRERVVPGLRFIAARMGREGKFEHKALLEVKKVWLDTSEVAVVKTYPGVGPVIDGDMIINPFYNPHRPVIVAFAGHTGDRAFNLRLPDNNPKPLRFSAREAANRIKEIGSEARMSVSLDADFVIFTEVTQDMAGRDQWPDYKKAVLLEIPLADAADYYEYLGG